MQTRDGATWDGASNAIVFAGSPNDAQSRFERELCQPAEGDNQKEARIRKIAVAPFVGHLLTETGNVPLDWPKIREQAEALLESIPGEDFEQGYWADVDQIVRPEQLSFSVATLQSDVPEEIRSGLNWSGEKQFFFLLLVLPLPRPPQYLLDEPEAESRESEEPSPAEIEEMNAVLPETVAVIQARNSVVAAWLWRRYAASTPWNANGIQITPLCGMIGDAV